MSMLNDTKDNLTVHLDSRVRSAVELVRCGTQERRYEFLTGGSES